MALRSRSCCLAVCLGVLLALALLPRSVSAAPAPVPPPDVYTYLDDPQRVSGDLEVSVTPYDDLDRAFYPFARVRKPGWNTLHVNHAVTGVGDTPHPVRPEFQVRPDRDHTYTVVLRPVTRESAPR